VAAQTAPWELFRHPGEWRAIIRITLHRLELASISSQQNIPSVGLRDSGGLARSVALSESRRCIGWVEAPLARHLEALACTCISTLSFTARSDSAVLYEPLRCVANPSRAWWSAFVSGVEGGHLLCSLRLLWCLALASSRARRTPHPPRAPLRQGIGAPGAVCGPRAPPGCIMTRRVARPAQLPIKVKIKWANELFCQFSQMKPRRLSVWRLAGLRSFDVRGGLNSTSGSPHSRPGPGAP
jgi:hypothetical protein